MKVVIVAKTRRGGGACVGAITEDGRSIRLVACDAATNARAGLEYEVGEVWQIEFVPDTRIVPPHIENVIVARAVRVKQKSNPVPVIHRLMPPVVGGPETLFEGLAQTTSAGSLYIAERTGLPRRSTMFWRPDQPLQLDCEGKRIRYRYPTSDGGRTLTFVGFQEPLPVIPSGTLLRVSLAHWWRPKERTDEELRCFLQLSGWFLEPGLPRTADRVRSPADSEAGAIPDGLRQARRILKDTFGFSEFLPLQAEVVGRALRRLDTLAVMPTGGGKSLCYQLPALLHDGLTVVASPLIALMQDQVSQLRELRVPAAFLNSTLPLHEYTAVTQSVRGGGMRVLYLAPETLLRPETLLLLDQSRLACFTVDEAHCISEWGHDFRPEYRELQKIRRRFPHAVCLAFTATATPRVRQDIRRMLDIPADGEFVAGFDRKNLFLAVQRRQDGLAQLLAFLDAHRGQSGIIYCGTRKQTEQLVADLNGNGWPCLPYHAGLDADVRRRNQERFIHDETPLMAATVAFGMGIDKANVRFVIHYHLPKDVESYYQEIGRAGRDGLPAECLLLHSRADAVVHRRFIEKGADSQRPGRQARLQALLRYAEASDCRRASLLAYFDEHLAGPCGHCDNCLERSPSGETTDVTVEARKFLSCVRATGEIFGMAHVISVLRGSRSSRILARGHDRLSVFGAGKERSVEEWRQLAEQFIRQGLLEQDLEFGGLRIAEKGWKVIKGEKVCVAAQKVRVAAPESPQGTCDPDLFQCLRELRRTLAAQAGVPSYVIFSDRSLTEMATSFPLDETQLLAIHGVGQVKLANYGVAFLQAIREHCRRKLACRS